jgi:hypothetical protein
MWLVLAGAQVEGTAIPEAVPEAEVIVGSTTEPAATAAPEVIEEMHDDALPKTNMDIVIWSPEIQDAELFRLAPMPETVATSRDGLELLADDLIDSAMVARHLESMRRAEPWIKVRDGTLE